MRMEVSVNGILNAIEEKCRATSRWEDGDYMKDGLHHCGKCHTPKQVRLHIPYLKERQDRIVYCLCKCEHEKDLAAKKRFNDEQEARRRARNRNDGLGAEAYKDMNFGNFKGNTENQKYLNLAFAYVGKWQEAKKRGISMIFVGGPGVGKSFTAGCIANALIDDGANVYMATMGDMLTRLSDFNTAGEVMQQVEGCDLLIIDDFGAERATDFASEKVFEVIDRRVLTGKPFIVTTNLTRQQLESPSGLKQQRIYSRLVGNASIIEFDGIDKRLEDGRRKAQADLNDLLAEPEQQSMF